MKIKDIVQESVYDFFTKGQAAINRAGAMEKERQDAYKKGIVPSSQVPQATSTPAAPATDIKDTVPAGKQFRFKNPENPGTYIIIRQTGYYVDKLPQNLQGQVKRDKATGLYPVLRAENIAKYNQYYDQAADAKAVIEEPVHAL